MLSATFGITNVRTYAPCDLLTLIHLVKGRRFLFLLVRQKYCRSKSRPLATQRRFRGSNAGNFNYSGETNFALLRYVDLAYIPFLFLFSSKVIEYMESMSYRQARESSRMKNSRRLFLLDEIKLSARDQHVANTENE